MSKKEVNPLRSVFLASHLAQISRMAEKETEFFCRLNGQNQQEILIKIEYNFDLYGYKPGDLLINSATGRLLMIVGVGNDPVTEFMEELWFLEEGSSGIKHYNGYRKADFARLNLIAA